MAQESSFDIVCKLDLQEVRNAVSQAVKEIRQRFDFKGSKADIALDEKANELTLSAEDDMKLRNLAEVLRMRLVKRSLPLKAFAFEDPKPASLGTLRQTVKLQQGIPTDKAKEIVRLVKDTKIKVQTAIQGDQLRVSGKNKDDLQAVMRHLKESALDIDMQFTNYR
jgi:uncharacterized protein YajQ (UPF0234 family)